MREHVVGAAAIVQRMILRRRGNCRSGKIGARLVWYRYLGGRWVARPIDPLILKLLPHKLLGGFVTGLHPGEARTGCWGTRHHLCRPSCRPLVPPPCAAPETRLHLHCATSRVPRFTHAMLCYSVDWRESSFGWRPPSADHPECASCLHNAVRAQWHTAWLHAHASLCTHKVLNGNRLDIEATACVFTAASGVCRAALLLSCCPHLLPPYHQQCASSCWQQLVPAAAAPVGGTPCCSSPPCCACCAPCWTACCRPTSCRWLSRLPLPLCRPGQLRRLLCLVQHPLLAAMLPWPALPCPAPPHVLTPSQSPPPLPRLSTIGGGLVRWGLAFIPLLLHVGSTAGTAGTPSACTLLLQTCSLQHPPLTQRI